MAARHFEASVRHQPGLAIIDLEGEIDAFAEDALKKAHEKATIDSPKAVLLNFEGVDYINSTGIALIVGLLAESNKSGRRLMTCGLSDHYQEIFRITRLADYISIYTDEESATADMS